MAAISKLVRLGRICRTSISIFDADALLGMCHVCSSLLTPHVSPTCAYYFTVRTSLCSSLLIMRFINVYYWLHSWYLVQIALNLSQFRPQKMFESPSFSRTIFWIWISKTIQSDAFYMLLLWMMPKSDLILVGKIPAIPGWGAMFSLGAGGLPLATLCLPWLAASRP